MLEYSLYLFVIIMVVKIICNHIELVGWRHYSNKLKKDVFQQLLNMYDGDEECAILELQGEFKGIDSDLGAKKYEFLSRKGKEFKYDTKEEKPDFSLIKNKSKKLVNFWDYYFNTILCRKDLLSSADPQIRIIYYARKVSSMIDIMVTPQPTAMQFIGLFLQQLEIAATREAKLKKIEEEELPESIKKKLEKAA